MGAEPVRRLALDTVGRPRLARLPPGLGRTGDLVIGGEITFIAILIETTT